ncbi:MAG: HAD family phosphatase [Chitinivibrionales bacterium]|nr:HAD family phosphatase [Chitinivibrionales bacterium]
MVLGGKPDAYSVVFDLGGVLIQWNPDAIVSSLCLQKCDESLRLKVKQDMLLHSDWLALDQGILSEEVALVRFSQRIAVPIETIERIFMAVRSSLTLIPQTLELVRELSERGLRLYCLSNMPEKSYSYLRCQYDFWPFFCGILISSEVKLVKPMPEIYQLLLTRFNLQPHQTIFIDDSPKNVAAAVDCGMNGCVFHDALSCRETLKGFGIF